MQCIIVSPILLMIQFASDLNHNQHPKSTTFTVGTDQGPKRVATNLGHVWNIQKEHQNGKSTPFLFINAFGLFFKMGIELKDFTVMKIKSRFYSDFDSSLIRRIFPILFPFLFSSTQCILNLLYIHP